MQIDSERGPRLARLRERLCERLGLERTVALRRKLLGANRRKFVLGRRKIREKRRVGVDAGDSRRTDGPTFDDVAFPMHVADETALAEGEAAREDRVALPGEASARTRAQAQPAEA